MFMETYGTAQIKALTRASRAFYENPPQGFSDHPLLSPRGVLYVATSEQKDLLHEVFDDFRSQSPNVALVDARQAVERVPCLRGDQICGAIEEPDARDIDVHALHQGFLRGMSRQGAVLHNRAEVVAAAYAGEAWTLTLADGRSLRARALVNAAGAWADHAAVLCGARPVGLQPCRRTAFTFSGPEGVDFSRWPAVVGVDESYYFKPDAGQLLGSTRTTSCPRNWTWPWAFIASKPPLRSPSAAPGTPGPACAPSCATGTSWSAGTPRRRPSSG
jgi:D-arginine dehydrogenase